MGDAGLQDFARASIGRTRCFGQHRGGDVAFGGNEHAWRLLAQVLQMVSARHQARTSSSRPRRDGSLSYTSRRRRPTARRCRSATDCGHHAQAQCHSLHCPACRCAPSARSAGDLRIDPATDKPTPDLCQARPRIGTGLVLRHDVQRSQDGRRHADGSDGRQRRQPNPASGHPGGGDQSETGRSAVVTIRDRGHYCCTGASSICRQPLRNRSASRRARAWRGSRCRRSACRCPTAACGGARAARSRRRPA